MKRELVIDRVIIWREINHKELEIYNLGHMNEWRPTDQYIKDDNGIYCHYIADNAYAAPIDKFIDRYDLKGTWIVSPYGYFPQGFFDIFKSHSSMDLERTLKTIDIRLRRKPKDVMIMGVVCRVTLPTRIQVFIDFGNQDEAVVDIIRVININNQVTLI